jgi:hypothetical protein
MRAESANILQKLADAIADGAPVDWTAARRRLQDPDSDRLLRHLRFVSAFSAANQKAETTSSSMSPWFVAFIALAFAQVVAGLGALAVAPRDDGPISPYLLAANAVAFALGAATLLVTGSKDRRTKDLVGFFLAIAAACSHRPLRWLMTGDFAAPGALALFRGLLPDAFLAFFLWRFAGEFPRTLQLGWEERVVRAVTRVSALAGGVLFLVNAITYARNPESPWTHPILGWMGRSHSSGTYWTVLFALSVGAVLFGGIRRRRSPMDEKRRVSFFAGGLLVGIGPLLSIILAEYLYEPARAYIEGPGLRNVGFAIYLPMLTVPLTLAYAITARRMIDVSLTVRRGARRLLARSTVAILLLATGGVLGWYLYVHRDQSVGILLRDPGARILAVLFLAACIVYPLRSILLEAIDRSEERFDRHTLVADLTARGRTSRTLEEAIAVVAETIGRGVDAGWVNVFARETGSGTYVALGRSGTPLTLDGGLARILENSEAPLVTEPTDPRSAFGWLPSGDRLWIADNGVAAVAAVADVSGGTPGFVAVGPKRQDLPWSGDDLSFLAAAASSAAFVLGSIADSDAPALAIKAVRGREADSSDCRTCGRVQEGRGGRCTCGGPLDASVLPLVLSGKFKVRRVLGRGGMGVVYEALDLELDRTVALKTLPRLSPDAAFRLRREARTMATQIHPNLALIFAVESWRGVPVLVLEYLAGGTLRGRMGSQWSSDAAIALGSALAGALDAMHSRGLLHRDVKPSNIGFTECGTAKLLDFGLAAIAHESSGDLPGVVAGTRRYLSPEALRGANPTVAQDLWALAVVLYEVLAGKAMPPPSGSSGPDPRLVNPSVPEAVAAFLMAALAATPDRRFKTATEFKNALAATAVGGSLRSVRSVRADVS